jgi:DNA-binding transcriptional ArsR family regulator
MTIRSPSNTVHKSASAARARGSPSARVRGLRHVDPEDVSLQTALHALADPVRRSIVRQLAASPDWMLACGTFDLSISKTTCSHHFAILRDSGLLEQRDEGPRRLNRLRRAEFERRFPGLLGLVLQESVSSTVPGPSSTN